MAQGTNRGLLGGTDSLVLSTEATVKEIFGDSLPDGPYVFAVSVQLENSRGRLSAGDAVLDR